MHWVCWRGKNGEKHPRSNQIFQRLEIVVYCDNGILGYFAPLTSGELTDTPNNGCALRAGVIDQLLSDDGS